MTDAEKLLIERRRRGLAGWELANAIRLCMNYTISIVLLVAALYVILFGKYDAAVQNWAFTTIGALFGAWVRPSR